MDSDGNLTPLDIFKILFPKATSEDFAKHKDHQVILCRSNKPKMILLVVCSVK